MPLKDTLAPPLGVNRLMRAVAGGYFSLVGGCGFVGGKHNPPADSIPPKRALWKETITYGNEAKWGNYINATQHEKVDSADPFKDVLNKEHLEKKQVIIIRDSEGPSLIISIVDREKEKELFGEEETRGMGIKAIEHAIPEHFRVLLKEGKMRFDGYTLIRNVGVAA